jgi:hypothetical protein
MLTKLDVGEDGELAFRRGLRQPSGPSAGGAITARKGSVPQLYTYWSTSNGFFCEGDYVCLLLCW